MGLFAVLGFTANYHYCSKVYNFSDFVLGWGRAHDGFISTIHGYPMTLQQIEMPFVVGTNLYIARFVTQEGFPLFCLTNEIYQP